MNFLPDNYQAPSSSMNYMKIQQGENKLRILSQPVIGWEDWGPDNKPIRYRFSDKPSRPIDPKKPIRHFWSMIVWNYNEEKVQILHITQATIRKNIEGLSKDSEWGMPYFYDLKITRTGEGKDSEYIVNPLPHKMTPEHVIKAYTEKPCNLEALFLNEDPFVIHDNKYTAGIFTKDQLPTAKMQEEKPKEKLPIISRDQLNELVAIFTEVKNEDCTKMMDKIGIKTLAEMPSKYYDAVKSAALKLREEFLKNKEPFDLF